MKKLEDSIEGLAGKFLSDGLTPENFTFERAEEICRNTVMPTRNLGILRLFKIEIIEVMHNLLDQENELIMNEQSKLENKDITF